MKLCKIKAGRLLMFPIVFTVFAFMWMYDYFFWNHKAKQEKYWLTQGIAYAFRDNSVNEFMEYCVKWLYGLNPDDNIDGELNE